MKKLFLSLFVALACAVRLPAAATAGMFFPVGTIAASALDGGTWLQMNGQVVAQATYPALFKIIGHQPEFNWRASAVLSSGFVAVNGVAFGNSVYVAVLGNGGIYTSADRITWTSRTSGVATSLNAICWDSDNSLFVTVGASNVILTSPDGTTWTSRTSGVTSTLNNVIHANGRTVAVGSAGWVTYSTNDTAWTASVPNAAPTNTWLLYHHSTWFAAPAGGNSTGIVYSTDGITWNYVAKPTTNNSCFLGGDATYFYVNDISTGEIFRSTTGATWASINTSANNQPGATIPIFFSSGVIATPINFIPGYTDDGFSTLKRISLTPPTPQALNVFVVFSNPMGSATQKFAIGAIPSGVSNVNFPCYSVDGKTWHGERFPFSNNAASQIGKYTYVNGVYFQLLTSGFPQVFSAPDPYDPATQFQIPTRADTTATPLVIKAL